MPKYVRIESRTCKYIYIHTHIPILRVIYRQKGRVCIVVTCRRDFVFILSLLEKTSHSVASTFRSPPWCKSRSFPEKPLTVDRKRHAADLRCPGNPSNWKYTLVQAETNLFFDSKYRLNRTNDGINARFVSIFSTWIIINRKIYFFWNIARLKYETKFSK